MDAAELARWTRFAAKGGIGKCTATQDCIAENPDDLMFLKGDEITVLMQLSGTPDRYLGSCEGVVGRFLGSHVRFHGKLKRPVMTKRVSSTPSTTAASPAPSSSPSPRVSLSSLAAREASESPVPPLSQRQIDMQRRASSRAELASNYSKEPLPQLQKSRSPSRERLYENDKDSTALSASGSLPTSPKRSRSEDDRGQGNENEKSARRGTRVIGDFAGMYSPPPSRSASGDKGDGNDDDAKSEKSMRRRTRVIGDFGPILSTPLVESPPPSPRPPLSGNQDDDELTDKARKRRTGLIGEFAISPSLISPSPIATEFRFPPERKASSPTLATSKADEIATHGFATPPPSISPVEISTTERKTDDGPATQQKDNHDHAQENTHLQDKSEREINDDASLKSSDSDRSSLFHVSSSGHENDDNKDFTLATAEESRVDITVETDDGDGGLGLGLAMLQDMTDASSDSDDSEDEWIQRRLGFVRTPEPSPGLPPPAFSEQQKTVNLSVPAQPTPASSQPLPINTSIAQQELTRSPSPELTIEMKPPEDDEKPQPSPSEDGDLNDDGEWDGADDIYDNYRYSRYSMASSKKSRYSMMSKASSLNEPEPDSPVPPIPIDTVAHRSEGSSSIKSASLESSPGRASRHLPPPLKLVQSPTSSTLLSPASATFSPPPLSIANAPTVSQETKPLSLDVSLSPYPQTGLTSTDPPNISIPAGRSTPLLSPLSPAPSVASFSSRAGAASALRQKLESERGSREPTPQPPEPEEDSSRDIVVEDDEDVTVTRNMLQRVDRDSSINETEAHEDANENRSSVISTVSDQSTVSTVPTISSDIVKEMQRMEADLAALEKRQAELTSRPGTAQGESSTQTILSPSSASFNIPSTQPLRINHDRSVRSPMSPQSPIFPAHTAESEAPPPSYTQSQSDTQHETQTDSKPVASRSSPSPPPLSSPLQTERPPGPSTQPALSTPPLQIAHQSTAIPEQPQSTRSPPMQSQLAQTQPLFLPHPNAPRPNPALASGQRTSTYGTPPVHDVQSQATRPTYNSLQSTLQMAAAARIAPNGSIRNTTIYGKTLADLSTSIGPVPIIWSLEPFSVPPKGQGGRTPKRAATTAGSPLSAELAALPESRPAMPLLPKQPEPTKPEPPKDVLQEREKIEEEVPRSSKVIPRQNFFPHAGGARPRSRSFSGLTSEFTSGPKISTKSNEEGERQPTRIASMQSLKGAGRGGGRNVSRQSSTSPTNTRNPSMPSPLSLPQNNTVASPAPSPNPRPAGTPLSPNPGQLTFSQSDDSETKQSTLQRLGLRQFASSVALRTSVQHPPPPAPAGKRRNSGSTAGASSSSPPSSALDLLRRFSSTSKHKRTMSQHSRSSTNSDAHSAIVSPPPVGGSTTSLSSSPVQRSNSLKSKLSLSALRVRSNSKDVLSDTPSPTTAPPTPLFDFDKKETVQVKDTDFEMVTPAIRRVSTSGSEDMRESRPSLQSDFRSESPATTSLRSTMRSPIPGSTSEGSHSIVPAARYPKDADAAAMAAHRSREQRWITTMATVPASQARKNKKVKKLVLEGVPASVRYLVWAHLTDCKGKRTPGIYAQLGKRPPVSAIRDIERDAALCFPDHPHLRDPKGSLVTLLQAYLTMVPDIEYQRSLAIIAGHILLLAPEEDGFWILTSMMDTYLRPYFSSKSVQMEADATVFGKAIDIVDSQLAKKLFSELRIPPIELCRPWFPSILASTLPLEYANRVWDVYLCEGPTFLFRVGLALLSMCRSAILTSRDANTVLAILGKPAALSLLPADPEELIIQAFAVKIKDDEVKKQRTKVEGQLKRQTQSRAPAVAASISSPRS